MDHNLPDIGFINRTAVVIKPKKPFFDLMKRVYKDHFDEGKDPDYQNQDPVVYLLPDIDSIEEMEVWLRKNFDIIFREQLNTAINCGELLVDIRTFKIFKEWFDYSLHTEVWDTVESPVIKI